MKKKIKANQAAPATIKLPSAWKLVRETAQHMWLYKRIILGMVAVYLVLTTVFVKGFSNSVDIASLKDQIAQTTNLQGFTLNASLFTTIVGSGGANNGAGSVYQLLITIVMTLAFIWFFRRTTESKKNVPELHEPFYKGMSAIVPFILVLFVVGLCVLPMLAGISLYSTVLANGLATSVIEQAGWILLAIGLSIWTFYLLSSSVFALYIVTLTDVRPVAALKSAKKVVAGRRWVIMRKFLLYIILVGLIFALLLFLVVLVLPIIAEWFVMLLSALLLPLVVGSGYKLYRALL